MKQNEEWKALIVLAIIAVLTIKIVVDHPQRAEAHLRFVVVVGEGKSVVTVEPAVAGVPAFLCPTKVHHDGRESKQRPRKRHRTDRELTVPTVDRPRGAKPAGWNHGSMARPAVAGYEV